MHLPVGPRAEPYFKWTHHFTKACLLRLIGPCTYGHTPRIAKNVFTLLYPFLGALGARTGPHACSGPVCLGLLTFGSSCSPFTQASSISAQAAHPLPTLAHSLLR